MPLRDSEIGGYAQYTVKREEPRPLPGVMETISNAFHMENDVVNAYERMTRPSFPVDPNFDLGTKLKEQGLWELRDDYLGVRSDAEMTARTNQIQTEQMRRQRLAEAGWPGVIASIAAGAVSPTTFIPLIGPGLKGAKAVAYSASLAAMAAGAQEGALLTNQETRTGGEMVFSVAASTILGGILGGAASLLSKGKFDRIASDMATPDRGNAIYTPVLSTKGESVGAARASAESAGGLAPGLANKLAFISPVTRNIQQERSPMLRAMAHMFSDAGMKLEGAKQGIAAAEGGNIESLVKTYATNYVKLANTVDDEYANYLTIPQGVGRNAKAFLAGMTSNGKMSKAEFREAIGMAAWSNDEHPIKEVASAAKRIRKDVIDPLFKEATDLGIFDDVPDLKGDVSYFSRIFQTRVIAARFNEFTDILAKNYEEKLQRDFLQKSEDFAQKSARDSELIGDLGRTQEEADALKIQFNQDLEELDKSTPEHVKLLQDDIAMLRQQLRKIPDSTARGGTDISPFEIRQGIQNEIRNLTEQGGEALKGFTEKRRSLERRLRNLNRSRLAFEQRQATKIERLERIDELSQASLNRAVRSAARFLKLLDRTSPAKLKKEISKLKTAFAQAGDVYDRGEERLLKLVDDKDVHDYLALQEARADKMSDISARLENAENFDQEAWKQTIDELVNEALEKVQNITLRRGARAQRLLEDIKKTDPKLVDERIKKIAERGSERKVNLLSMLRDLGGENIDLANRTADFSAVAKKRAEDTAHKILRTNERIQINDLIKEERGPELARVLEIDSRLIAEFLEKDVERVIRAYVRTMGADISTARVSGTTNMQDQFLALTDELTSALENIKKAVDKDGKPLSKEAQEKLSSETVEFYRKGRRDMEALLERIRGVRGVPDNPDGWAARGARMAMNLNTLRFMGGVVLASVSDPARVVQKHGLINTFKDGFLPMIRDLKTARMSQREAKLAGTALDVTIHSRAHAISDVLDEYGRGSKFERGLEFASNKIGVIALFDYWTSAWKQFTAGVVNARILDAISTIMEGGADKKVLSATEYLASVNLGRNHIEEIWKQINNGGGGKVNGVWLPNTDTWDLSKPIANDALRAYRAALAKEVDDTIVTPGLERPLFLDRSIQMRMLTQFKSFGMASTTKTLMAGMQEKDARYVNGVMISLALGTLSYYLWATAVGGDAYEEMLNAGPAKWADEAITRSGQTAVFDEFQRIGQRVPGISPYLSFSGTRSTRREGGDLTEALLGPTFDLLEKANGVISGVDDPTRSTLHAFRQILPFQNLFFLRQAFDAIEAAANLPERRQ